MAQHVIAPLKVERLGEPETGSGTNTVCVFSGGERSTDLEGKIARLGYDVVDARHGVPAQGCVAAIVYEKSDPDLAITRTLSERQPVILIAEDKSFAFRLRAARAGVEAILWPPIEPIELGAWLSEYNKSEKAVYSILIVDDDEIAAQTYALALESAGMKAHVITDPTEATEAINRTRPDLVLLDMNMPVANGLEVARIIRQSRQNLSLPIMFLSAERDAERRQEARRIGGDDFISKPVDLETLAALVEIRAARARSLRQIMERDSLTGLLNHARFKDRLAAEIDRSKRTGSPISVSILDLDHFKKVNDTYGHQAGDKVIQTLAHSLSGALRRTDIIARYGGEEFAILLLDTQSADAVAVMNKIRCNFAALEFEAEAGPFSVTLSAGISQMSATKDTAESVIRAADNALYQAKDAGRNRVVTE
jgi:diguanylate cyclase (GGDEF)-like protein